MKVPGDCGGAVGGTGCALSGPETGGLIVGPSGPVPTGTSIMLSVGFFTSDGRTASMSGLNGSLSNDGTRSVSVMLLSSVVVPCGMIGSLAGRVAGGPGCRNRKKQIIIVSK